MNAKDTLIRNREVDAGCGDDESVVDITSWLETQAEVSFEAGQREGQSQIGELEAQLADIKNQFKIQIETARQEERDMMQAKVCLMAESANRGIDAAYKEGLAEGGKIRRINESITSRE